MKSDFLLRRKWLLFPSLRLLRAQITLFIVGFVVMLSAGVAAPEEDQWDIADAETVRLSVAEFPELPESLKDDLVSRNCKIPQVWGNEKRHNIIQGHLTSFAQTDWAVLCSVDRTLTILVYRGGDVNSVLEVSRSPDKRWLQVIGDNKTGFSREISVVDVAYITQQVRWHEGEMPSVLDHDGINESFIGKASVIYYWHDSNWVTAQSSD